MIVGMMTSPCNWPIIYPPAGECGCGAPDVPVSEMDAALEAMAVEMLWAWTGRKFGVCDVTIRPCRDECAGGGSTFWGPSAGVDGWSPVLVGGEWFNVSCGSCAQSCGCGLDEAVALRLPGEVAGVVSVWIEGELLPSSAYSLRDGVLFRADGGVWPACNNPLGDPRVVGSGAWEVAYETGTPVPTSGQMAAGLLSCELRKAACRDKTCQLPQRVQSVTRQGVSIGAVVDSFEDLKDGRTGIWLIDSWVAQVNAPRTAAPQVFSPGSRGRGFAVSPPLPPLGAPSAAGGGGGGGGGAVSSVNGQTGHVVLNAADIGAATTADILTAVAGIDFPVDSVNGLTGDVVITAESLGAATTGELDAVLVDAAAARDAALSAAAAAAGSESAAGASAVTAAGSASDAAGFAAAASVSAGSALGAQGSAEVAASDAAGFAAAADGSADTAQTAATAAQAAQTGAEDARDISVNAAVSSGNYSAAAQTARLAAEDARDQAVQAVDSINLQTVLDNGNQSTTGLDILTADATTAVNGFSDTGIGVAGTSADYTGMLASSDNATGLHASSALGVASKHRVSALSLENISEFAVDDTVVAAIKNDGRVMVAPGVDPEDAVTVAQLEAATSTPPAQPITTVLVVNSGPSLGQLNTNTTLDVLLNNAQHSWAVSPLASKIGATVAEIVNGNRILDAVDKNLNTVRVVVEISHSSGGSDGTLNFSLVNPSGLVIDQEGETVNVDSASVTNLRISARFFVVKTADNNVGYTLRVRNGSKQITAFRVVSILRNNNP